MRCALPAVAPFFAGILAVLLALPAFAAAPVQAGQPARRVALVVGNSAYRHVAPLSNPANDARLMAESLKALGFELVGGKALTDLPGKADMEQAVQRFGELVRGAAVGLFFYAGHGVQVDGKNYLVPVGANVAARTQIKYQLLDADYVLDEMAAAGTQVNVVVLDACRNNPFGDRGLRDVSSGLAQIMAPKGTLVAYSTAPGRTAADGAGKNSPFTAALARQIKTPGLRIDDVFMRVGAEVERQTGGEQSPWKSDNLRGVFCLAGACAAPGQPGGQTEAARIAALERELAEKTAQAEQARAEAARVTQAGKGADAEAFARPVGEAVLSGDASWRMGGLRTQDGSRFNAGMDDTVARQGSGRSMRMDFEFTGKGQDFHAPLASRKRRDLTGFAGVELAIKGSRELAGFLTLNCSHPNDSRQVDRFFGSFRIGTDWTVVRVPFAELGLSRAWRTRGAAKNGLTPGDGVLRLDRVEELRVGVSQDNNPPGPGAFWVDGVRLYK